MIKDPYAVLGVSRNATPEEIKKAYREKAKQYHPDLHPNDPKAAEMMNEINVAYDYIQNPEKLAKDRRNEQARQGANAYSGAGRYSSYGNYGRTGHGAGNSGNTSGYGNSSYGGYTYHYRNGGSYQESGSTNSQNQSYGYYQNSGSTDSRYQNSGNAGNGYSYREADQGFDPFNSGFGFYRRAYDTTPHVESTDSHEIREVIELLQRGAYADASDRLLRMRSQFRNARWYYLIAYALYKSGDADQAYSYMKTAYMNSNNPIYRTLLQEIQEARNKSMEEDFGTSRVIVKQGGCLRVILFLIAGYFILRFAVPLVLRLINTLLGIFF